MVTKLKIISASTKCHKWRVCYCNYFRVSYFFYNEWNIFVREKFFSTILKKIKKFRNDSPDKY